MSKAYVFHRSRFNSTRLNLGIDVSADEITCQIRTRPDLDSELILTWDIDDSEASDGYIGLSFNDNIVPSVTIGHTIGYMSPKRITGGAAVPIFDEPLPVVFRGETTE